jgi:hypothetical protein
MSDYFIDYEKVLTDLESKRDAIDDAIRGIKKLIFVSTQLLPDGTIKPTAGQLQEGQEIQSDTFFGLTTVDAIEKYLRMMKKPQSYKVIADSLEAGGFAHTSKRFTNTVATTLDRMSKGDDPKVVKIKGEWGLIEWYPGIRKSKALAARRDDDASARQDDNVEEGESIAELFADEPSDLSDSQPSSPSESAQPSQQSRSAA